MAELDQILCAHYCLTPSLLCLVEEEEVLDGKTLSTAQKGTGWQGCFTQIPFHTCPVCHAEFFDPEGWWKIWGQNHKLSTMESHFGIPSQISWWFKTVSHFSSFPLCSLPWILSINNKTDTGLINILLEPRIKKTNSSSEVIHTEIGMADKSIAYILKVEQLSKLAYSLGWDYVCSVPSRDSTTVPNRKWALSICWLRKY